ncbi:MAG: TIGR03790 family protein [Candidatus Thermoplasmatota archaeon]|jgi:uncharacterized protein (TIGR03790 family)|nr:TIGR03790 family protein [Candidatus Thermoplasmatota archaeon]
MKAATIVGAFLLLLAPVIWVDGLSFDVGSECYDGHTSSVLPLLYPTRGPMNGSLNGLYGGIVRYEDVALLVNDNSVISREIGTYFAMRRGLPVENIINLSVPNQETISPGEFDELARQVKENLSKRGLSDKIQYMVTTKGVPLRVSGNNWRMSSVDSELMLLDSSLEGSIHSNGWIDNPYFESWGPFSRETYGIRLVTRLDGYTKEEAMRLVDLAEPSLGVRGRALLDTDPTKGYSASGYGIGNYWMVNAHDWLVENGHESLLDMNNTFRTEWTNTSAYFSWGSNDGDWGKWLLSNSDFERGTDTVPASWRLLQYVGSAERSQENVDDGSFSLKMTRSSISNGLLADQSYNTAYLDHRFIFEGRVNLASVTGGPARAFAEGFDLTGKKVYFKEFYNRTGSRAWESFQGVIENRYDMVRIRVVIELAGTGTAYWDNVVLRVIRPHNQWVPGGIAETCVSTGGRSMAYGTWYGQSLVADLIRDGVTGVKGYVYEPFLSAISHADILFPAYYSSYNLAEAYWMGSEFGSWMDTVLGDPKCAPYLNERADMGFPEDGEPISTYVDDGAPHLSIALYNKGKGNIAAGGKVELYMDGLKLDTYDISLSSNELKYINLSYKDEPLILGPHEFKVVLNSDGAVWEMDPYNNEVMRFVSVNRLPKVLLEMGASEVRRTEPVNITALLMDEDGGIGTDRLDIRLKDPYGNELRPNLSYIIDNGASLKANFSFVPEWNASLGFYTVIARYTDEHGSYDDELLYGAFKVQNFQPELEGYFASNEIMRGSNATLSLSWSDPDTPDGNLTVQATTVSSMGDTIRPNKEVLTSGLSGLLSFELPSFERSRTWEFKATAVDRDGAQATWTGVVHTNNGIPVLEVGGLGKEMNRLSTTTFTIKFTDPEGLPPNKLEAKLIGPEGEGTKETVLSKELSGRSGEVLELLISSSGLIVGNYTLEVIYEDDEYDGSVFRYPGALKLVNILPTIGEVRVIYPEGEGSPGEKVMRGSSFSIKVPVVDSDGDLWTLRPTAMLTDPQGAALRELSFEPRPDQTLHVRVSVGTAWSIGPYGLDLVVVDKDGGTDNVTVRTIVIVDAPTPVLLSAKATVDVNMTCSLEVVMTPVTGSSLPVAAEAVLGDRNGTVVGSEILSGDVSGTIWTAVFNVTEVPTSLSLNMRDDLGRDIVLRSTLEVKVEKPQEQDDDGISEDDDSTLIFIILFAFLVILLIAVMLVLIIVVKRKREPTLRAPPPMAVQLGTNTLGNLPPGPAGLTQGDQPHGLPPAPLPPGRELNDGSSYHKPGTKESERPRQRPSRPEDIEEVHELGPRRPAEAVPSDVPMASVPSGPGSVPEPLPFDLTQPINKGDEVVPQVTDVQDTHHNDIPGDTG